MLEGARSARHLSCLWRQERDFAMRLSVGIVACLHFYRQTHRRSTALTHDKIYHRSDNDRLRQALRQACSLVHLLTVAAYRDHHTGFWYHLDSMLSIQPLQIPPQNLLSD